MTFIKPHKDLNYVLSPKLRKTSLNISLHKKKKWTFDNSKHSAKNNFVVLHHFIIQQTEILIEINHFR